MHRGPDTAHANEKFMTSPANLHAEVEGVAGAAAITISLWLHALQQAGQDGLWHDARIAANSAVHLGMSHADWQDCCRHVHLHLLTAWRREGVRLHLRDPRLERLLHACAAEELLLLLLLLARCRLALMMTLLSLLLLLLLLLLTRVARAGRPRRTGLYRQSSPETAETCRPASCAAHAQEWPRRLHCFRQQHQIYPVTSLLSIEYDGTVNKRNCSSPGTCTNSTNELLHLPQIGSASCTFHEMPGLCV